MTWGAVRRRLCAVVALVLLCGANPAVAQSTITPALTPQVYVLSSPAAMMWLDFQGPHGAFRTAFISVGFTRDPDVPVAGLWCSDPQQSESCSSLARVSYRGTAVRSGGTLTLSLKGTPVGDLNLVGRADTSSQKFFVCSYPNRATMETIDGALALVHWTAKRTNKGYVLNSSASAQGCTAYASSGTVTVHSG